MKKMFLRAMMLAAAVGAGFVFVSCDEGPMERGGKKVDRAVEKAGDKIEDATDRK